MELVTIIVVDIKWQKIIILPLILISLVGIIYSGVNLIIWAIDNNNAKSEIADIDEKVSIEEIDDSEETEVIEPEEPPNEFNPYWDYIKYEELTTIIIYPTPSIKIIIKLKTISDRSVYNFNTSASKNDKILTLSSCYINSDNKIVLHAKLIKRQKKQH